jgi:hypothetical protein
VPTEIKQVGYYGVYAAFGLISEGFQNDLLDQGEALLSFLF